MRYRLHKRLFFRVERLDDWVFDRFWEPDKPNSWKSTVYEKFPDHRLQQALCLTLGHVPINDQCCKPEHDFCAYCGKSMPGKA